MAAEVEGGVCHLAVVEVAHGAEAAILEEQWQLLQNCHHQGSSTSSTSSKQKK